MKAKLTTDWEIWKAGKHIADLAEGTEVSIVPNMEADAESVLNRPEGMCYLCKLNDCTCTYIPAVYLQITDCNNVDWEQRRYELAKELYVRYETMSAKDCVRSADELIKQLKEQ